MIRELQIGEVMVTNQKISKWYANKVNKEVKDLNSHEKIVVLIICE